MNPTAAGEDPVDRPVRPSAEALTVARILEIRDALLPSQGEPFDCVAFAVEIVKAERARLADECPAMPEPYTRQWINAPFTERLVERAVDWPRADPAALAAFDPSTKLCTMNCGPHRDDPRTRAECKLLCGDCAEDWNR